MRTTAIDTLMTVLLLTSYLNIIVAVSLVAAASCMFVNLFGIGC